MADKNKNFKKKGGTIFPKYSLKDVRKSLKPLISKTHLTSISIQQLNSGVFSVGANSPSGKVRYSALKQFGLVDGTYAQITPSKLAKSINIASVDEAAPLLQQAFLHVKVFRETFETFHSDTTSRARILGYATNELKVHPDSGEAFMESFLESATEAGLGRLSGDNVELFSTNGPTPIDAESDDESSEGEYEDIDEQDNGDSEGEGDTGEDNQSETPNSLVPKKRASSSRPNIDIKIDPTLDPDKLEKQLAVLRKFKLI